MANIRFNQNPTGSTINGGDLFVLVQNGVDKVVPFSTLTSLISGGTIGSSGSSVTGGTYNGTLLTLNKSDNTSVVITGITDTFISGGTLSTGGTLTLINNKGQQINVIGFNNTNILQAPNTFYRGPISGTTALPVFGPIVAGDIPVTAVVAGSYTNATIIVGPDGRVTSAASGTSYIPRGQLFSVSGTQWGTSTIGSNFIQTGSGPTYTFNSTNLTVSGGTGLANFIAYNYFSLLNDWTAELVYVPTQNTAGVALSWGRYGASSFAPNLSFWLDTTVSSASILKVHVSGVQAAVVFNDNKINVPSGSVVTIRVTEMKNKFIFAVEVNNAGVRSEQLVEFEKQFYVSSANVARSTWGIVPVGGTSVISSFSCFSRTLVGVDLAIVGDSYLEGLLTINEETTLGGILEKRTFSRVLTYAKGGCTTQDLIDSQAELLSLLPKNVYLNISANQISSGAASTFNAVKSVADALTAQGCNVYIGKAYVRAGVTISDLNIFNNLVDANYPSDRVVDAYTPFLNTAGTSWNPIYTDAAGTHFNLEGNRLHADICWAKFKSFLAPSNNYEAEQTYFNKYYSNNSLISYPNFNNFQGINFIPSSSSITSNQTSIPIALTTPLSIRGVNKGYAKFDDGTQFEYVLVTGIDDASKTITVIRAQLGTTAKTFSSAIPIAMLYYVLATNSDPLYTIDHQKQHVINGLARGTFISSTSSIYAASSNNILSIINSLPGLNSGDANFQISKAATSSAARIRFMTGTNSDYEITANNASDFNIGRAGQNDIYLSAGNIGINKTTPLAKLDINGSFASKTLRTSATTLTLDSTARAYFFIGSGVTTWTLPLISTSTNVEYYIKNTGTANITLVTQGGDQIFYTSPNSSLNIAPSSAYILQNDGVYWQVM